jgi:hypothetical protein
MPFDSLLPLGRERQPDDNYDVRFAGFYLEELNHVWDQLMAEAQHPGSLFLPDDLCEELLKAVDCLAKDPHEPPARQIYSDTEVSRFEPTHICQGKIFHIWYLVWESDELVAICQLEPSQTRGMRT